MQLTFKYWVCHTWDDCDRKTWEDLYLLPSVPNFSSKRSIELCLMQPELPSDHHIQKICTEKGYHIDGRFFYVLNSFTKEEMLEYAKTWLDQFLNEHRIFWKELDLSITKDKIDFDFILIEGGRKDFINTNESIILLLEAEDIYQKYLDNKEENENG